MVMTNGCGFGRKSIAPWWQLKEKDFSAYEERKAEYVERMFAAAERAIPGLRKAVSLCLPGTPVTFERFTRRPKGMVGGFAQESLFSARAPATGLPNVWMVGDSIFPGQSTAGVTLGALRVAAQLVEKGCKVRLAEIPLAGGDFTDWVGAAG